MKENKDIRAELIEKKVAKLRYGLEEWAKKELVFYPGEVLVLSLEMWIENRPFVEVIAKKKPMKMEKTDLLIGPEDWKKMLLVHLTKQQQAIINIFFKGGNKPLFPEEIFEMLSQQKVLPKKEKFLYVQDIARINTIFSKHSCFYRIKEVDKPKKRDSNSWGKYPLKIFIVKPRE